MSTIILYSTDMAFAALLEEGLAAKGYQVVVSNAVDLTTERIKNGSYDLLIADSNRSVASTYSLIQELRAINEDLPILMLGTKKEREDIVAAYGIGCDEYILKPITTDILQCKIDSWLRRMQLNNRITQTIFNIGRWAYDSQAQTLTAGTQVITLSVKENEILRLLANNIGTLTERRYILRQVWKTDSYFASRSLSVYINRLRKLLSTDPQINIISARGKGYKLVIENT